MGTHWWRLALKDTWPTHWWRKSRAHYWGPRRFPEVKNLFIHQKQNTFWGHKTMRINFPVTGLTVYITTSSRTSWWPAARSLTTACRLPPTSLPLPAGPTPGSFAVVSLRLWRNLTDESLCFLPTGEDSESQKWALARGHGAQVGMPRLASNPAPEPGWALGSPRQCWAKLSQGARFPAPPYTGGAVV